MYGKVDLTVANPVASGATWTAVVTVTGVKSGGDVTIVLEQKRGVAPFMGREVQTASADAAGKAIATFDVALRGPARASLLATAYDVLGPHFEPDVESVEVLP